MKRAIAGSLVAICVLLFTTALGLALITTTDFPYVTDIDTLKISENTGLSREEILSNYHAVISYLSPFSNAEFTLPTLGYTEKASFHFAECKTLFNEVYLVGLVSGLILAFLAIKKAVSKKTLKLSGIITLLIPILLAVALMTNFDRAFTFFHSIFFAGATWLFDPAVDEIINILPSEFFMHCAFFIALFWVLGAVAQLISGFHISSKKV